MDQPVVPQNIAGKPVDLSETVTCSDSGEAINLFARARNQLLHPDTWSTLTGALGADFSTTGQKRPGLDTPVKTGDLIQIDLPAPGSAAGRGHDWVRVSDIADDIDATADESFAITVRVAQNPEESDKGIAHFFADGATSTFILARHKNVVSASYHGRNEQPNFKVQGMIDKLRNAVVAYTAIAGASALHWTAFLKALMKE